MKKLALFIVGFFAVVTFVSHTTYQYGYDEGRETCKKPIDMKIKPMTYKQQVKWAIWMNREREVVK